MKGFGCLIILLLVLVFWQFMPALFLLLFLGVLLAIGGIVVGTLAHSAWQKMSGKS